MGYSDLLNTFRLIELCKMLAGNAGLCFCRLAGKRPTGLIPLSLLPLRSGALLGARRRSLQRLVIR